MEKQPDECDQTMGQTVRDMVAIWLIAPDARTPRFAKMLALATVA